MRRWRLGVNLLGAGFLVTIIAVFAAGSGSGRGLITTLKLSFTINAAAPERLAVNNGLAVETRFVEITGFMLPDRIAGFDADLGPTRLFMAFIIDPEHDAAAPFIEISGRAANLLREIEAAAGGEPLDPGLMARYLELIGEFADAVIETEPPEYCLAVAWWGPAHAEPPRLLARAPELDHGAAVSDQTRELMVEALAYIAMSGVPVRVSGLMEPTSESLALRFAAAGTPAPAAVVDTGFRPGWGFAAARYLVVLLGIELLALAAVSMRRPGPPRGWTPTDEIKRYGA